MKRKLKEKKDPKSAKKRTKSKTKSKKSRGSSLDVNVNATESESPSRQLEHHILNFSRLGQSDKSSGVFGSALSLSFLHKKKKDDDDNDGVDVNIVKEREESRREMDESLSFLTNYLTFNESKGSTTSTSASYISKTHVASLIFPWITKSLVQKLDNAPLLVWNAFTACLETLLLGKAAATSGEGDGDKDLASIPSTGKGDAVLWYIMNASKETGILQMKGHVLDNNPHDHSSKEAVGSILSQGTMNKLVPCMIRTSFGRNKANSSDEEDVAIRTMAAKSFGLIVTSEFYRPTTDYVCNTLIPLVDEVISKANDEGNADVHMKEEEKGDADDGDNSAVVTVVDIMVPPDQVFVVYLTLQLLVSLQSKGRTTNPKKTFQLISSSPMLVALARFYRVRVNCKNGRSSSDLDSDSNFRIEIEEMVKKVVWWALFDPRHHIDGFRSMTFDVPILDKSVQSSEMYQHSQWTKGKNKDSKKASNRSASGQSCYQQRLFNSIEPLMGRNGRDDSRSSSSCVINMSLFLPLLVEGFMSQLADYDTKSSNNTSRRADFTAKLQFRFWSNVVNPLVELVKRSRNRDFDVTECQCLLESIQKCLLCLLQFDGYLPSYDDKENMHLNYLSAIGKVMLDSAYDQDQGANGAKLIQICRYIFTLNHNIFHKNLSRLIACSAKVYSKVGGSTSSSELVCSLANTYQKLRQLGHFTKSVLTSASDYCKSANGKERLRGFPFLRDILFRRSMSLAIQNSPIGQVQEVWECINKYIIDTSISDISDLMHAVEIFVVVLKAIRVGQFNAKNIQDLCEKTMSSCVPKLIKVAKDQTKFDLNYATTNHGLYLWGWIVFVHTKCCFWLNEMPHEVGDEDNSNKDGICGANMLPSLVATIQAAVESRDYDGFSLEALQHLACHRIQQLHSSIFQQEQTEQMKAVAKTGDIVSLSPRMNEEAKLLVKFIFHAACHRRMDKSEALSNSLSSRTAGWKVICETMATWLPYSSRKHHTLFLQWFFLVHSVMKTDKASVVLPLSGDEISQATFHEERASAMALLHDVSFFECRTIFEDVVRVGFSCALKLLQCEIANDELFDKSIFDILTGPARGGKKMSLTHVGEVIKILQVMKSVHVSEGNSDELVWLMKGALYIHVNALKRIESHINTSPGSYYHYFSSGNCSSIVSLMNICEELISDAFSILSPGRDEYIKNSESITKRLVPYILRSSRKSLQCLEKTSDESDPLLESTVLHSGSRLLSAIAAFSLTSFNTCKDHIEMFFMSQEQSLKTVTTSHPSDFSFYLTMIRPSFQRFTNYLDDTRSKQIKISKSDRSLVSCVERGLISLQNLFKLKCISHTNEELRRDTTNQSSVTVSMLFLADIFSSEQAIANKKQLQDTNQGTIREILHSILNILETPKGNLTISASTQLAVFYLFSSMVGNDVLDEFSSIEWKLQMQNITLNQYQSTSGRVHPLLDSAFATILSDANPEEVSLLASDLITTAQKLDLNSPLLLRSSAVYCFHMMCNTVKGQSQRGILSALATRLLSIAFGLVYRVTNVKSYQSIEDWTIQILTVQGMMRTLIEKNDLILLKGCDVANVLATVSSIFINSSPEVKIKIDEKVYISSCNIIGSLLKYYPKQLYSCTPSLSSAIRALLNHVILASIDGHDNRKMIQEFTKICEMLPEHKDIFKKHLMHTVLFFVEGMESSMDSKVKTQLEPAIFFLLSTLSEFEIKQMNTMMKPTSRVLLQTVFRNFQKNQYKGQF